MSSFAYVTWTTPAKGSGQEPIEKCKLITFSSFLLLRLWIVGKKHHIIILYFTLLCQNYAASEEEVIHDHQTRVTNWDLLDQRNFIRNDVEASFALAHFQDVVNDHVSVGKHAHYRFSFVGMSEADVTIAKQVGRDSLTIWIQKRVNRGHLAVDIYLYLSSSWFQAFAEFTLHELGWPWESISSAVQDVLISEFICSAFTFIILIEM